MQIISVNEHKIYDFDHIESLDLIAPPTFYWKFLFFQVWYYVQKSYFCAYFYSLSAGFHFVTLGSQDLF